MAVLVGCGSTKKEGPKPARSTTTAATTATTSSQATTTTAASASGLSGTWSGRYSGAYNGTFTLTWQQSGTSLSGSIKLSSPASTLGITGNVKGSLIRFGAVGGVTYSGTVSGNSMSGRYRTPNQGSRGSGSWSATKAS